MLPRRLVPFVALVAAAGLAAAGCSENPSAGSVGPDVTQWSGGTYTALGDSFTTGAGLGEPQPGELARTCLRTEANYPSRLAEALGLDLDDRSCGSARSQDILTARGDRPAQIEGVTSDTDLVTLRVGANDGNLFQIFFTDCTRAALDEPMGSPCREEHGDDVPAAIEQTGADVGAVLAEIRRRAPDATVMLVGYSRLLSASGTCPGVPFSSGDVGWIADSERDLDQTLAAAAEGTGARYVSLRGISEGRDLCEGSASWINDLDPGPRAGIALHPNRAEVAAVIELLTRTLATTDRSG